MTTIEQSLTEIQATVNRLFDKLPVDTVNVIKYGTEDLEEGVSELATGTLYLVIEE